MRRRPGLAQRHPPLRRQPQHGLHGRTAGGTPKGVVRQITESLSRLRHGHVRGQPRVHELRSTRSTCATAPAFDRRRPRVPPEVRGQGRRRDPRPDRDVHGQAVQRPGRLGLAPAHLARARRTTTRSPTATARDGGRADAAPAFVAGVLAPRARADGVPEPDGERLPAASVPGLARADARQLGLGQPHRRSCASRPSAGAATRVEVRVGDGSANPYLAIAATLFGRPARAARRARRRRPPVAGDAYTRRRGRRRAAAPLSLDAALDALRGRRAPERRDRARRSSTPFLAMKRFEIERHRAWVSDWELDRVPPPPLGSHDTALQRGVRTSPSARRILSTSLAVCSKMLREDPVHWNPEGRTAPASTPSPATTTSAKVHHHTELLQLRARRHRSWRTSRPDQIEARKSMIDMDPPRHDELRRLMRTLAPRAVLLGEKAVRTVTDRVLDAALPKGEFDFVARDRVGDPDAGLRRDPRRAAGGAAPHHRARRPAARQPGPGVRRQPTDDAHRLPAVLQPGRAGDVRVRPQAWPPSAPQARRATTSSPSSRSSR